MIRHHQPQAVPASKAPFSQMVLDERYVFLAGLVAADFPAGRAVLGDIAAETRCVLDAIRSMLAEIDLSMDRIVRVDVHLSDFGDFDAMDTVYRDYFVSGREPARTTTESRRLFGGSKVEITCQALQVA